jgi:predicted glutamine amidotransferase
LSGMFKAHESCGQTKPPHRARTGRDHMDGAGLAAFSAVTPCFGQIPRQDVSMIGTCRRCPVSGGA